MRVIKSKFEAFKDTAATVARNVTEFVQASSLVTVAAYAGYAVKNSVVTGNVAYVIAGAAAIIAVRGAVEMLRHFNK